MNRRTVTLPSSMNNHARLSRRHFLFTAACATGGMAFPSILPSSVFGADGQTAPSNQISLGCIGVGGMGTYNLKNFAGQPGCRVVAVCDVMQARRENAKEIVDATYGDQGCAMIADWREVMARKDIDAVMIATPDHWHSLMAVAAANAGKDMYCEKPMGVSLEDGQAIRDAVRKHKRMFQAGTWQRSARDFRFACEPKTEVGSQDRAVRRQRRSQPPAAPHDAERVADLKSLSLAGRR